MWRELQRVTDTGAQGPRSEVPSDYFSLFGLLPTYVVDADFLQARFRELQRQLHPDRFAQATEAQRRASVTLAAQVNDAYTTLRDPLRRARYLMELQGIDTAGGGVVLSSDFLQVQIDWREAFADAASSGDRATFDRLTARLRDETRGRYVELTADLTEGDGRNASRLVAELQFLEKLAADVVEAMDRWEDS